MRARATEWPSLFPHSSSAAFDGFGPSTFRTVESEPTGLRVRSRSATKLRAFVRQHAPRTPGVYGMLGSKGQILYVGKAKDLRARLLSYFRVKSRDPKAGRILERTAALVWEDAADEFAALLRELELIRRFRPRFNVLGQPGRRAYVYLCLGRGPASYVHLTREPTGKELAIYGPFAGRGRSEEAIRKLNHFYGLRDCSAKVARNFADVGQLFDIDRTPGCLRYELGTCLGPCAGMCTSAAYGAAVKSAKAFLDGRSDSPLAATALAMAVASEGLRFEQAAVLRDRLALFEWLDEKLKFLRSARAKNSFVYPLEGADGRRRWYLIHTGEVQAVLLEPTCPETARQAHAALSSVFEKAFAAKKLERCVDSVLIVTSWFRKRSEEKPRLLTHRQASQVCRELGNV